MAEVILVGKDWKTRALLRAQLLEEGVDTAAYESLVEAFEVAIGAGPTAKLLVADLSASADPTGDVAKLADWARRIPIWVIARRSITDSSELEGHGFEAVLFRPICLGELVERIKQRLRSSPADGH